MPIYEYACDKCGHEFEAEQRITDAPIKTCPACRSRKVKKLISRTSFVLKGGGWYSDLYSSGGGKSEKSDGADSGAADKSDKTEKTDKTEKKSGDEKKSGGDAKDGGKKSKDPKAAA